MMLYPELEYEFGATICGVRHYNFNVKGFVTDDFKNTDKAFEALLYQPKLKSESSVIVLNFCRSRIVLTEKNYRNNILIIP